MTDDVAESAFSFGLVCEGSADARTAKRVVRRVLEDEERWLSGIFESVVEWRGVKSTQEFTTWSGPAGIRQLTRERGIPHHGEFAGELDDGRGEAIQTIKALRLFRDANTRTESESDIAVVFLVRDSDGRENRRPAMSRARDESDVDFGVVLGVPHTKRECWVLVAAEFTGEEEQRRLEELRAELGFDPTVDAHKLSAQSPTAKRNAKRVLKDLFDGNLTRRERAEREDRAIESARLDQLERSGEAVSLAEFIGEIRERVPSHLDPLREDDGDAV